MNRFTVEQRVVIVKTCYKYGESVLSRHFANCIQFSVAETYLIYR